jgi:hypothetical protein
MKIHHHYYHHQGLTDLEKIRDDAHRRANDTKFPENSIIHYHTDDDMCPGTGPNDDMCQLIQIKEK